MEPWYREEDIKYSDLYSKGYPIGNPMGLIKKYNISRESKCIDLGCGRGSLSNYFENYTGVDVSEYIIAENKKKRKGNFYHLSLDCLDSLYSSEFDVAICADVMEHIPEDKIENVLESMSKLSVREFFFGISTRKSVFLDSEGDNLHLAVLRPQEWLNYFSKYFTEIESKTSGSLLEIKCKNKKAL